MRAIALSHAKKRYLVHVYLTQGYTAAKPLAVKYGISPRTMSKYTRAAGIKGKQGRETKPKPIRMDRWQTAIERGSISI